MYTRIIAIDKMIILYDDIAGITIDGDSRTWNTITIRRNIFAMPNNSVSCYAIMVSISVIDGVPVCFNNIIVDNFAVLCIG